jgi:gamma-glutamyltranspeptidase
MSAAHASLLGSALRPMPQVGEEMKKITDKDFVYVPAEKTKEPGYLSKRFQEIRQKQKEEAAARLRNVISNRRFK